MAKELGRRAPTDWEHVQKYPLTAATVPEPPMPIAIGVNWYSNFDHPEKDSRGSWWIGRGDLGSIRGGHCVCIKPDTPSDASSWWPFYDQGYEGACVGFGCSRMMSLANRKRYHARWLWDQAKLIDEWDDTNPGDDQGTSVRAACEVLRSKGHVVWRRSYSTDADCDARAARQPLETQGIGAYRWATTVDEMVAALSPSPKLQKRGAFPVLNSWGRSYPRVVWLPFETMARLLQEDGEAVIATDR